MCSANLSDSLLDFYSQGDPYAIAMDQDKQVDTTAAPYKNQMGLAEQFKETKAPFERPQSPVFATYGLHRPPRQEGMTETQF